MDEDQEFGHKNKAMFLNQQTNKQTKTRYSSKNLGNYNEEV